MPPGLRERQRPPEQPGSGGRPEERRLHPVTPWRRAWAPVAAMLAFGAQEVERSRQHAEILTAGGLLVALAVLLPAAAAYGFLSWWVTRYTVAGTELRIRTGLLFRRVAHIRLDRVQAVDVARPLPARVLGVAKLKLDVVGAESKDELAFLGEREAVALRAELLARAAGMAAEVAAEAGEAPSRELARVGQRTLAVSLLLLGTSWGSLAAAVAVPLLVWRAAGSTWPAVLTAVALLGGVLRTSVGRFLAESDWVVAESPDGVRVDRGLLDRAHATVPPGRIQAVRVLQPRLWRGRGWVRVELDVAAVGEGGGVLLPVAPFEVACGVLARVLPGVDLREAAACTTPAPRRACRVVPLWWRGYGQGVTGTVFAVRSGLLCRRLTLVPHAKVQSVRFSQGPWERRHGLADVHVDHGGNGTATARLRAVEEARGTVAAQAERSRTGRRAARPERWLT